MGTIITAIVVFWVFHKVGKMAQLAAVDAVNRTAIKKVITLTKDEKQLLHDHYNKASRQLSHPRTEVVVTRKPL